MHLPLFHRWCRDRGFLPIDRAGRSEDCFLVGRGSHRIDVHVFEYDAEGRNVSGIAYPWGSLTGSVQLGGELLDCVAPEWMLKFKTSYPPAAKDRLDVQALCAHFGWDVPPTHA